MKSSTSPSKPASKDSGLVVGFAMMRMDTYFDEARYIPFKRYLLRIIIDGRRTYSLMRIRNRMDALVEKALLASYRGILPLVVDTKTGLRVDEEVDQ